MLKSVPPGWYYADGGTLFRAHSTTFEAALLKRLHP
jgi:hypothetical protein